MIAKKGFVNSKKKGNKEHFPKIFTNITFIGKNKQTNLDVFSLQLRIGEGYSFLQFLFLIVLDAITNFTKKEI